MALAISGSNGGIFKNSTSFVNIANLKKPNWDEWSKQFPMEVSYFINNTCNLKCKHCYVGYKNTSNELSIQEWKNFFNDCLELGALTFGNVGKEPLLNFNKTLSLLEYLNTKRQTNKKIRFGLVTNATLLDPKKINELTRVMPDYLDVSLDGGQKAHDQIRGAGNYDLTINNLKQISKKLLNRIFIGFTLNNLNFTSFGTLVNKLYKIGLKKFVVSPYVPIMNKKTDKDFLFCENKKMVGVIEKIVQGKIIEFDRYENLDIYIKSDYSIKFMFDLAQMFKNKKFINEDKLEIDEYGVIFTRHTFASNTIYFSYCPWETMYVQTIRVSHDGFIGDCYSMFFEDYPNRTIGNIKNEKITQILNRYFQN